MGVGVLVGLHEDGDPVVQGAHLGGGADLELGAGVAQGVVVAGGGTAQGQDLAVVLGLQSEGGVGAAADGGIHGQVGAGVVVGGAGGAQILAGDGVGQVEAGAVGGGDPGQGLVIGDNIGTGGIGLDLQGHGSGIAADGVGADIGIVVAVVDQDVTLAGLHGGGLAPDLTLGHGFLGDLGGHGLSGSGLSGGRLGDFGLSGSGLGDFGLLGGSGGGVVTGHGGIQGVIAGVNAGAGVGGVLDGVVIDDDGHDHVPAGAGGGVGAGGGGLHVAAADVGEVQLHALGVAAAVGADGHGAALGVVVVAGLVILVVVTEEEGHVHLLGNGVDGGAPLVGIAVVVAVVQQGLVGDDQQGAVLQQLGGIGLEIGDGLIHGGGEAILGAVAGEACAVAVVGGDVGHAQQVDVVVAVVGGAVNAVVTGTVDQVAGLVQQSAAVFLNGVAVMVGPDVVDGHIGIAHGVADVAADGGGVAGVLAVGAVRVAVDGKCVAAADDVGHGQARVPDGTENALNGALLVVALAGVQIGEDDRSIDGSLGSVCAEDLHRSCGDHQNQNQQCRQESFDVASQFHSDFSFFSWVPRPKGFCSKRRSPFYKQNSYRFSPFLKNS